MCVSRKDDITERAYAKTQQSNYIVEVATPYKLPLCIDGGDNTRNECYNKDVYANDAID